MCENPASHFFPPACAILVIEEEHEECPHAFFVNSRLDRLIATSMVPLLPKLRGCFAEFLRQSYLASFAILYHWK